jgi:hypothetical protein
MQPLTAPTDEPNSRTSALRKKLDIRVKSRALQHSFAAAGSEIISPLLTLI